MNDTTTFEFNGMIFQGLKLSRNVPTDEFYSELIEEGSGYSRGKYIDAVHEELDDQIHIKLSFSIISKVLSIFGLFVAVFLGTHGFLVPALIVLGAGFGFEVLYKHFKTRANELFTGRNQSIELVNVLFNI